MVPRPASDRGASLVEWAATLFLASLIMGALLAAGLTGTVQDRTTWAVCVLFGTQEDCDAAKAQQPPAQATDPDEPTGNCLVDVSSEYLETTVSGKYRYVDIITDGGAQLALRKYKGPDGKEIWDVWDMAWSDAGAGASLPAKYQKKGMDAGAWATIAGSKAEIYRFDNEKDAREFYKQRRDHRIGNWAKLGVRTNPVLGGALNGFLHIPLVPKSVRDKVDDWFGGSEADRKPDEEYHDGGVMAGFFNDISLGGLPLSVVGKDFGWASGGVWKNNRDDTTTYYFQGSDQLMESLELDVGKALKKLKLYKKTSANVEKAITYIEDQLTSKFGTPITLPGPVRRALATDTGLGIGLRGTVGRWYGITYKDGKPIGFTQVDDVQGSWHLRGDVAAGPLSAWMQDSQGGTRWRTTKELDLTKPEDMAALRANLSNPVAGMFGLDQYFADGGGRMSKVDYDYHVNTKNPSLNLGVAGVQFEDESAQSTATSAEYFKPGFGWVKWNRCGL
jgi:hypothetical protein